MLVTDGEYIKQKVNIYQTEQHRKGKSYIIIGDIKDNSAGVGIKIESNAKFNWFQKKMWKYLLNINIEDIK